MAGKKKPRCAGTASEARRAHHRQAREETPAAEDAPGEQNAGDRYAERLKPLLATPGGTDSALIGYTFRLNLWNMRQVSYVLV
jgi:hypothetical protein